MIVKPLAFHVNNRLAALQFTTVARDTLEYISGDRAMKAGLLEVREVSESGSVNQLFVINTAAQPVFFMDGDILIGAKQNRVINTSMLIGAGSKTTIAVTCVEGGRWQMVSKRFSPSDYVAPSKLRSGKSQQVHDNLQNKRGYLSDQGDIWDRVASYQHLHEVRSPTSSLSDIFEARRADHGDFLASFTNEPDANGCAFFIDNDLVCVDVFNRRDIYAEYFPKLLRGIGLEMVFLAPTGKELGRAEAEYKTLDFLDTMDTVERSTFPGAALGTEQRFQTETVTGFGLYVDEQLVHFSALRLGA
ncbi:MAG: hypothetical protein HY962_13990 [Ignavibacteriae bacterium]|nr:hypothetical protein [Ignavibacteriota bacterium]